MFPFNRSYIVSFFFCIAFSCAFRLSGQPYTPKTDSLITAINKVKSDSDKVVLLMKVSESIECTDTARKLQYASEALLLADSIKWNKGISEVNMLSGRIYHNCVRNNFLALKYCSEAKSTAQASGDKINEARALDYMADIYETITQYSNALDCYRQALDLKVSARMEIGELGNIGLIYNKLGDYPSALTFYDSSIKVLDESMRSSKKSTLNDTLTMAGLLITIGEVYLSISQYDKALENYNNAEKISLKVNHKYLNLAALTGIGDAYRFKKEPEKAIQNYQHSLVIAKEINSGSQQVSILNKLANIYLETGELSIALSFAQNSQKRAEDCNITEQIPQTYTTLGAVYTKLGKYDDAISYLQKAIALCQRSGVLDDEKTAWEALSKAYEAMGQPAKSLDAYRHFISIRDSVYNISKANELTRIDLQANFNREKTIDSVKQAGAYKLKMQKQMAYTFSGYIGFVLVLLLSFFIYRNYSQQKKANTLISKAHDEVTQEKQVSENLLLNILPDEVAKELKQKGGVDAKLFDNVSVMFTDFVNFTFAGEHLSPQELVAELHTCFVAFDEIIGKYDVEKIKTIGDAYMAVSGLPRVNEHHAGELVRAAIEIRDFMVARKNELGDKTFDIRVGINSGTVVAGIVGVKKFAYDIWGDTVNIAARMEQYGEPGKINISQSTYDLVKTEFECIDRGELDAKHKGKMRMYFVETGEPKT